MQNENSKTQNQFELPENGKESPENKSGFFSTCGDGMIAS